jgi:hypothetical protein
MSYIILILLINLYLFDFIMFFVAIGKCNQIGRANPGADWFLVRRNTLRYCALLGKPAARRLGR